MENYMNNKKILEMEKFDNNVNARPLPTKFYKILAENIVANKMRHLLTNCAIFIKYVPEAFSFNLF